MNTINKITTWGDSHHLGWFDFFRIILGVFLFYKGLEFGRHPQEINELIKGGTLDLFSFFLIQYIPMVHLMGGVMIAAGFKTRWAVVFQLPVLLGAILLHLTSAQPYQIYSQLLISIVVFLMLMAFLVYGSGPYSADEYLRKTES